MRADAKSHFDYFNGGNRDSSADIFVDSGSVWIVNDYINNYTWHCGDGAGKYGITNANSVGVEFCVNMDGDRKQTIANTVEVVRSLMQELDISIERVVRHYDASKKLCPASMSKNSWAKWCKFKKQLKEEGLTVSQYEELKEAITELTAKITNLGAKLKNPMVYNYIDDNMPEWARPTIQKLVDKGILKGGDDGLNLTEDLMRILVINDRAGLYE